MKKILEILLAIGISLAGTNALAKQLDEPIERADKTAAQPQVIRVQTWQLLQENGAGLYRQLCASCHGAVGAGNEPATTALTPAPPLTQLQRKGVPRAHWAYVILSPSEDPHHWGPKGRETMPCWRRLFREALGNDAAPLTVSARLVDYLETIQE